MTFDFEKSNQKTNATGMIDWYGDTSITPTAAGVWGDYTGYPVYYSDTITTTINDNINSLAESISNVSAMSPSLGSLSETLTNMTKNSKPKTLLEQVQERLKTNKRVTLQVKKGRRVNVYQAPNSSKACHIAKLEEGDSIEIYDKLFPSENSSSTFAQIRFCTLPSSDSWLNELTIENGYVSLASEGLEILE